MVKNAQFSLDSIARGVDARATDLAITTRTGAITSIATTRITKISIKAITIR
jgi:hypothetical protein